MAKAEAAVPIRANRARRAVLATQGGTELSRSALSVLAAVPHWWERRVDAAKIDNGQTLGIDAAVAFPSALGWEGLEAVPPREDLFDASPEELADAYVVALDDAVRTANGRHYTPIALAHELYEQAVMSLRGRPTGLVWDPACGAGMLLLPALRAWLDGQRSTRPEIVLAAVGAAVGGRDLDSAAVWLGNVLLASELLPVWAKVPPSRRRPLPELLEVGNGLDAPSAIPQVTILNPPYGRVRLSPEDRKRWQHVVYGHANRYGLFMASAVEHLASGGAVSALVPAGWLGGSYFQRLRSYLASTAPLTNITYVTDRAGVFSTGVLQETVLVTFRKGKAPQTVACDRLTMNGKTLRTAIGKKRVPQEADRPWLLPRHGGDVPLVKAAQRMSKRLEDYGWSVSTGPLVWNRHKPQLSASPSESSVKIVWAGDLEGGELHEDPARDKLRYLQLRDKDRRVLVLDRPAVLVQRTTAPEQPRRLLAAALDTETLTRWGGRVSVENHVNVLTCEHEDSLLTPRLLTALLDSDALDRLYRCLTGSVAVSAYELAALPLPGPKLLQEWAALPLERLPQAINAGYGLDS
ncbi:Eco57I restriction-modification methylase domain-containing protein [Streptomyces cylindrosporus]|uniref:site-specific DNA-methyltransferase (adenine-specific) n=1 Tax=Streptomyces cylindrosporus TaxID=2927583 RepID=A0ABS9XYU0_9ACTN|nr:Eco57I restriction-modification methylase domain-containing protein [Streptomyces cylindrosporus]MCI3270112.1 Eco57I restriction-modification methylase domain-containing protein [Streptomyces cylindrosporus]